MPRQHWDVELVEAVGRQVIPHYRSVGYLSDSQRERIYDVIATVEDWFRQNAHMPMVVETCEQAESRTAALEAQVQAVRDALYEGCTVPPGVDYDSFTVGWIEARNVAYRVLDGGNDE